MEEELETINKTGQAKNALNIITAAWSLATTCAVYRETIQSPTPAQPTHSSRCQCGSGTASIWLKLCSSSL